MSETSEEIRSRPPMYVEDKPVEPEETDEHVESEDAPAEEASPDTVAADEAAEDQPDTKPSEPEKPKESSRDKALQKLQQRQTTFERTLNDKFNALGEQLQQFMAEIKAQGGRATPQQVQQIQETKDELDDVFAELERDDLVSTTKIPAVLKKLRDEMKQARRTGDDERYAALEQKIAQQEAKLAVYEQKNQQEQFWSDFSTKHPEIDGKGLHEQAWTWADEMYPNLSDGEKVHIVTGRFYSLVEQAEKEATKPDATPPVAPPRKTSPASTAGTQTVPPNVSASRSTAAAKKAKPPLWVED